MTSMTIVNVTRRFTRSNWGGTESVVVETGKTLTKLGHRVSIQTTTALDKRRHEAIDGIPVERHNYIYPYLGLGVSERQKLDLNGGNLVSPSLAYRVARLRRPDVLHLHTQGRLGGSVRMTARLRNIPYVVSLHGGFAALPADIQNNLTQPARTAIDLGKPIGAIVGARRVLDDAAAILCLNREELDAVSARFPQTTTHLLPHGIDLETFRQGNEARFRQAYGIEADETILLNIGNLYPQKNQMLLIRSFASLVTAHSKLKLVLIGATHDVKYSEKLAREVRALGIDSQVLFISSASPDNTVVPDALAACKALVCTSTYETFALVVLEAWAAQRAVVAPLVGGIKDLIQDNVNGLAYAVNNERALTRALQRLLASDRCAHRIAQAGYGVAREKYQWSSITQRLVNIYAGARE